MFGIFRKKKVEKNTVEKKKIDGGAVVIVATGENVLRIGAALQRRGRTVVGFSRAKDALASLEEGRPAAMVLQAELDEGSGYAVCNAFRKREGLNKLPLVFFSTDSPEVALVQHARLKSRADAYVLGDDTETIAAALDAVENSAPGGEPLFFKQRPE